MTINGFSDWYLPLKDELNAMVIIAAISSQVRRLYDVHVPVTPPDGNLDKESIILLNQIRTFDKSRLTGKLGSLSPADIKRVDRALRISLGTDGLTSM